MQDIDVYRIEADAAQAVVDEHEKNVRNMIRTGRNEFDLQHAVDALDAARTVAAQKLEAAECDVEFPELVHIGKL